jgi:hypothetical protein
VRAPNCHLSERLCCEIRQLAHFSQAQFKQGHLSCLFRKGDFLYSYQLWVEDGSGTKQIIPTGAILSNNNLVNTPLGQHYYLEFVRHLFPVFDMKCYELYTLHLGIVRADIVTKNQQQLIAILFGFDFGGK